MSTTDELDRWGRAHIPHFAGVYSSSTLPRHLPTHAALVCNYDPISGVDIHKGGRVVHRDGSHWVAIRKTARRCLYADSYGIRPDGADRVLQEPHRTHFKSFLSRHCPDGWEYQRHQYQGYGTDCCGQFSLAFLRWGTPEENPGWWRWLSRDRGRNCALLDQKVRVKGKE